MNSIREALKSGLFRDLIDAGKVVKETERKNPESGKFRDNIIDVEIIKETGSRVDRKVDNLGDMIYGLSNKIDRLQDTSIETPVSRNTTLTPSSSHSSNFGKGGLKGLIGSLVGKVKDTGRSAIQSAIPNFARKTDKDTEIYRTDVLWQLNQINSSLVKISKKVGAGDNQKSLTESAIDGLMDMASDFFDFDSPDRNKKKNQRRNSRSGRRGKSKPGRRSVSNVSKTSAPKALPASTPSPATAPHANTPALPESTSSINRASQKATSNVAGTAGKSATKSVAKTAGSLAKSGLKTAGKFAAKAAGKFIPGVGLAMGAMDAYDKFKNGDILGGVMSGVSGLVSTIPGVGGFLSTGLDLLGGLFGGGSDKKKEAPTGKQGGVKNTLKSLGKKATLGAAVVGGVTLASKAASASIAEDEKKANTPVKTANGLMSVIPAPEGIEDDIPELRERYKEAVIESQPDERDNEETKKRREKAKQKAESLKASIEKHDKEVLAKKGKTVDSVKDSSGTDKPATGQSDIQTGDKKPEGEKKESGSFFGKMAKGLFNLTPVGMAVNAVSSIFGSGNDKKGKDGKEESSSFLGGLAKKAFGLTPIGAAINAVSSLTGDKEKSNTEEKDNQSVSAAVSGNGIDKKVEVPESQKALSTNKPEDKKSDIITGSTPQAEKAITDSVTTVAKELENTVKQGKTEEGKQKSEKLQNLKGSATGKVQERSVGKKILDSALSVTPFGMAFNGVKAIGNLLSGQPVQASTLPVSNLPKEQKKTVSKIMPDGSVKNVEKIEPSYPMGVKADDFNENKSIKSGLEDVVDEISATSKKQIKTDEELSKKDIDTQEKLSEKSTNALGTMFSSAFPGVKAAWTGLKKAWNWLTGDDEKPEITSPEGQDLAIPKTGQEGQSDIKSGIEELQQTIKKTGEEQREHDLALSKKERSEVEDFEEDSDKSFFRNLKKTLLDVFEEFFGDGEKKEGGKSQENTSSGENNTSSASSGGGGDASQGSIATYEGLGDIMSKYETGGKGTAQITNSAGDSGGASYGKAQLSYTKGSLKEFVNSLKDKNPEMYQQLSSAYGSAGQGAKGEFGQIWTKLAGNADFRKYESEFIGNQYLTGGLKNIKSDELKQKIQSNPAIQEMFLSTCIQHGPSGGPNIFNKVYQPGMSDEDFIRAVYGERGRTDGSGTLVHFSKNSADIQRGVANRFKNEVNDILALNQKGSSGQLAMNSPSGSVGQGTGASPAPSPSTPMFTGNTGGYGGGPAPASSSSNFENTEQYNDDNSTPAEQQQSSQQGGVASKESLNLQSGVNFDDLNPVLKQRFGAMADEYKSMFGEKINVSSGKRTMEQQARLRAEKGNNAAKPNPLAPHISGLGLDASSAQMNKADSAGLLKKHGLWRPLKNGLGRTKPEAWHVEVEGSRDPSSKVITEQTLASFGGSTGDGTITASAPSGESGMSSGGGGYSSGSMGGNSGNSSGMTSTASASIGGNRGISRPRPVGVFQAVLGGVSGSPLGSLAGGVLDSLLGTRPQFENDTSEGMPPVEGQGNRPVMGGGLIGMAGNLISGLFGMNKMGASDVRGGTTFTGNTGWQADSGIIPEKEELGLNKKMGEPQTVAMNDKGGNGGLPGIPSESGNNDPKQPIIISSNTNATSSNVSMGGSVPRKTVIDDPTLIMLNSQILR